MSSTEGKDSRLIRLSIGFKLICAQPITGRRDNLQKRVFALSNYQQSLLHDAYRYAERVYILSHIFSAGIMVFSTILLLHFVQMLEQPSASRLLVITVLAAGIVHAARHWQTLRARLRTFSLDYDTRSTYWQVAPRQLGDPFSPVPARFVTEANIPAPAGVCWEIDRHAERYAEVRAQRDACHAAHHDLTNHDAVNLLLMAFSRRNAEHGSQAGGSTRSSRT